MSTLQRPGVYVEERLLSTPSSTIIGADLSTATFVAASGRGPTSPTLVTSWGEYLKLFGGFSLSSPEVSLALYSFFNNGGSRAFVSRVAAQDADSAFRVFNDTSTTVVLRVEAISKGSWGNGNETDKGLYIDVAAGSESNLFNLFVKFGGPTPNFIVERWLDLSMDPNHPRFAPTVVNGAPGEGSYFISMFKMGSGVTRPATTEASLGLSNGTNGAQVSASDLQTAIQGLDAIEEPFGLNLPGVVDISTINAASAYAEARGDVFHVIDTPANLSPSQAVAFAESMTPRSSYGAVYYPHVFLSDPFSPTPGATRKVAPGGAVLGIYAYTDANDGVHRAPAGINARVSGARSLERRLTDTDLNTLNSSNVNAIRHIPGAGVCVFGTRTLQTGRSSRYVPVRRTLIYLRRALIDGTRFAIFAPNDELLWSQLRDSISKFLMEFWQTGGLRGVSSEQAFYVKSDESINTPASIANGEVRVEVGVALQHPAEFVIITISQTEGSAGATVVDV